MKLCNNNEILNFLEKDIIKNFMACDSITVAGKQGFAIKTISFYTTDGKPSDSYISLCENIFNELIVEINTDDETLISDNFKFIKTNVKKYKKIRMGALSKDFFEIKSFKEYLKVKKTYFADYGVFGMYSQDELIHFPADGNVIVQEATTADKKLLANTTEDEWDSVAELIKYGTGSDIVVVIKENDVLCGYIIGSASYKNIYDVANIFVDKKYRGKSYGKMLTSAFASICFNKGLIPYYGTAKNKYSENVAKQCGFKEMARHLYVDVKLKFFSF